ncbi:SDR family oxidoreductase [Shewanella waksmanii]|uniref:SDR family oxidoreductase n=1 Tax=Shewanella waksmanii TaxID=213783 RepID=UPI0037366D35
MITSVAIVGCGWYGTPLAQFLLKNNLQVFGSKRDIEGVNSLNEKGINGFLLDLDSVLEDANADSVAPQARAAIQQDALVVNIPPGLRSGKSNYLERLQRLKTLIGDHQYQRVVFISTTGVYPATGQCCVEDDAIAFDEKSQVLLAAEQLFLDLGVCTVLRFAGLVGPKRAPGRFFAGKSDIVGGVLSVNMTHLDDCIGATYHVLSTPRAGNDIFNVCAEEHPSKQTFYTAATQKLTLSPPSFLPSTERDSDKTVNGERIVTLLNYQYHYNDPMVMLEHC